MLKRAFDILVSGCMMLLLLPVLLLLVILIFKKLGSPVVFSQLRPGLHARPFKMIKFRTMTNAVDPCGHLLPDEQRLTSFGQFLRSTSLDELLEFWNVLKGAMSLVGPRPLLIEYLPLYSEEQHRRHLVKPGITGWAQVKGRNAITWDEKFALDDWYVNNRSFWLDIKILLLTIGCVLKRDGINSSENVTMPKFRGNLTIK